MADKDLIIKIEANTKNAAQGVAELSGKFEGLNDVLKDSAENLRKVEAHTDSLGTQALHLHAAIELAEKAFDAMHKVFESTVEKFIEADDILRGLGHTLEVIGEEHVEKSIEKFKEFAEALEHHSLVSEETTLKLITMAKAIGRTDEQAEALVRTSANLSAVTKDSVESSFDKLLQTYKGVVRGVSQYDKGLKGLTEQQLRNGAAVDVLDKHYAGFAEKLVHTFGGQAKVIQNLTEHVLESVGSLFANFFRMDDRHVAIEALLQLNEFVKGLKPSVVQVSDEFFKFFAHVANGVKNVHDNMILLQAALATVAIGMIAAFGPAVLSSIAAVGTAIAAMAVSLAPSVLMFGTVAAAVVVLGGTLDVVRRNVGELTDFFGTFFKTVLEIIGKLSLAISEALNPARMFQFLTDKSFFQDWAKGVKDIFVKAFMDVKDSASKNLSHLDFGLVGKAVSGATDFVKGFNKELDATVKTTEQANKHGKDLSETFLSLSKEGQEAFNNLVKKVEELKQKQTDLGENVVKISEQRLAAEKKNIDIMEKDLEAKDALNESSKKLLSIARQLTEENSKLEVFQKQKKALDEIIEKNKDLQLGIDTANTTQADAIDKQLARQLELIEKKREELKLQGLLTDKANQSLNNQANLTKQSASVAKSNAANPIAESMTKAGEAAGKGITDAFAPMMGLTSGIDMYVAAAQAVVDAIPKMLENLTHLIESITALPMKILDGLNKLFDAILKHIANIVPNLIKAITGILKSVTEFLKKLPEVIEDALSKLPEMLLSFLDSLPDIMEGLVQALVESGPKIAIATTMFLIKDAPKIALKMMQTFYIELPKAFLLAIRAAFKNIGGMFSNLFKGKFDFFNAKKIQEDITNIGKRMASSASRLFAVADLTNASKAATNLTKQVSDEVDKTLAKLKMAWLWVYNKILQPIFDLVKKVFQWVWDHIFGPLFDYIKNAFQLGVTIFKTAWNTMVGLLKATFEAVFTVLKTAFNAVFNVLKTTWDAIFSNLKAIWEGLMSALKGAWDAITSIFTNLWEGVKKIWQTLMDIFSGKIGIFEGLMKIFGTVVDTLKSVFDAIFKSFKTTWDAISGIFTNAGEGLKKIFSSFTDGAGKIGESIWNSFKKLFEKAGEIFSNAGNSIWEGLKKALGGLGTFLTKIFDTLNPINLFSKIFKLDPDETKVGKGGTVENMLKVNLPFVQFAQGGYVPGNASVPGNSKLNDKIMALVSPGEAYIDRERLKNPMIKSLVDAILSGKLDMPKYALGGYVKQLGGKITAAAENTANITPEQVMKEIKNGGKVASDALKSLNPTQLWDIVKDKLADSVLGIFKSNSFAEGGFVGDRVPSMLDPREFVMNPSAVQRIGLNNLHSMNNGGASGHQTVNYTIHLPVTIENNGAPIDANWVRLKVLPTIQAELKRASLEGKFILSDKGIRNA